MATAVQQLPVRWHPAVIEQGSHTSSTSTRPATQSTVRTSMWSASSSAGGRVCGVTSSSWSRGPIVNASRTSTTQSASATWSPSR